MGWFDDNHPMGEAHRPGGYMNRDPSPDYYPRAEGKFQRRLEQRVDAALERASSQKCGHTRGATLSQCHTCQAAMRQAMKDEDPAPGRFAYGFDSAGRADYEFDGKDDKATQALKELLTTKDGNKPVPKHWCNKCENEKPLGAFSVFQLDRAGVPSDPEEFRAQQRERKEERKAECREEQKNSEEYQEERAEWREEQKEDRQCKRRQALQDARDNEAAAGRRYKTQRVEETDSGSDESDDDSAFDENYFRSETEDVWDDEDDEDDREPTVCIDCFWDFLSDAYQCDDDDYYRKPMVSESEWEAASKKGMSNYCGGSSKRNLRSATEEDTLERIESRLEGSSEWQLP